MNTNSQKRNAESITLYGNLGSNPTIRTFASREVSEVFFNSELGGPDTRLVTKPGGEFHTFSIAVNIKDDNGEVRTSWVDVVDHNNFAALHDLLKGDRVAVTGYFRERQGKDKTFRNLVLQDLRVERRSGTVRDEAGAEIPEAGATAAE